MLENETYICDRWMCWRNGWKKHVTSCADCETWRGNYYETRENIFQSPNLLIRVFGDFQDVVGKIFAFYQKGPSSAVCILSATGTISSVTLRQPGVSDGFLRHEVQLII